MRIVGRIVSSVGDGDDRHAHAVDQRRLELLDLGGERIDDQHDFIGRHDLFDPVYGIGAFQVVALLVRDLVGLQRHFLGHAVVAAGEVDRRGLGDLLRSAPGRSRLRGLAWALAAASCWLADQRRRRLPAATSSER